MVAVLESVPDHRSKFGRRYRLADVLALLVAAGLADATQAVAALEWAADQPAGVLAGFGFARRLPSVRTVGRILAGLDVDAVDAALSGWVEARDPRHVVEADRQTAAGSGRQLVREPVRGLAFDGKVMRGARQVGQDGVVAQVQVLGATWHDSGVVAGQVQIAGGDEIGAFEPLARRLTQAGVLGPGVVATADAKHTQHETIQVVREAGAQFLLVVKANQPSRLAVLKSLPWAQIVGRTTREKAHGRKETRTVKVVEPIGVDLGWDGAVQALKIVRTTTGKKTPNSAPTRTRQTVYAITSLSPEQVTLEEIAELVRGQWVIENKVHRVRDSVFDEDRHAARTGNVPIAWP